MPFVEQSHRSKGKNQGEGKEKKKPQIRPGSIDAGCSLVEITSPQLNEAGG